MGLMCISEYDSLPFDLDDFAAKNGPDSAAHLVNAEVGVPRGSSKNCRVGGAGWADGEEGRGGIIIAH